MALRRTLLKHLVLVGLAGCAARSWAAMLALVGDADPQAVALGYRANAAEVDRARYPKYVTGQQCANCALFQGKAGEPSGGCTLFSGRQVAAGAWCSAYNRKAG
jgi:hypothetical protein